MNEHECWEWANPDPQTGYCHISFAGKTRSVHRVSATLHLGFDIESPLLICHRCDNRRCFNPMHLFPGSHADNTHDMIAKGRAKKAKLNRRSVEMIRSLSSVGLFSIKELAILFGVRTDAIRNILQERTWLHVRITPESIESARLKYAEMTSRRGTPVILGAADLATAKSRLSTGLVTLGQLATIYRVDAGALRDAIFMG